jgi:hypothetical protein
VIGLVGREPVGQAGLEALAAGLERRQPDGLERRQQPVRVILLGPAPHKGGAQHGPGPQRADRGLAVVAEKLDQFVEDLGLVLPAGAGVALALLGQDFLSRQFTHLGVHAPVTPLLSLRGLPRLPLTPPSVTFFLSQIVLHWPTYQHGMQLD